MTDMVERVARALAAYSRSPESAIEDGHPTLWANRQLTMRTAKPLARAAIAAMREPSEEMRKPVVKMTAASGKNWMLIGGDDVIDEGLWRAMIDEALND